MHADDALLGTVGGDWCGELVGAVVDDYSVAVYSGTSACVE